MANCTQNDPCFCIQTNTTPAPTPCPSNNECCLKACSSVLECTDSVGPCGQVGSFNLKNLEHIVTGCSHPNDVKYVLEDYDKSHFASVTLTSAGILTWVTGGPETANKYGTVCFRITCPSSDECDDCIQLNALGYFEIGTKDLCQSVVCDDSCEVCDPCTGTCIEQDVKIEIV
jgi:hypothetical protein